MLATTTTNLRVRIWEKRPSSVPQHSSMESVPMQQHSSNGYPIFRTLLEADIEWDSNDPSLWGDLKEEEEEEKTSDP